MSYNPFFTNIPVVFTVFAVRDVNGTFVKTPIKNSKRLFFRLPNYEITKQRQDFEELITKNLVRVNNLKTY